MKKILACVFVGAPFLLAGGYLAIAYFLDAKGGELLFNVIAFGVWVAVWFLAPKEDIKVFFINIGLVAGITGGAYVDLKIAIFYELPLWFTAISILIGSVLGAVVWYFTCRASVWQNKRKIIRQKLIRRV